MTVWTPDWKLTVAGVDYAKALAKAIVQNIKLNSPQQHGKPQKTCMHLFFNLNLSLNLFHHQMIRFPDRTYALFGY